MKSDPTSRRPSMDAIPRQEAHRPASPKAPAAESGKSKGSDSPQAPAECPPSPSTGYFEFLFKHPRLQDEAMPKEPAGTKRMTDNQRETIRIFNEKKAEHSNPAYGFDRWGEYGLKFRRGDATKGEPEVVPNHPIRHDFGGAVHFQPGDGDDANRDMHNHWPMQGSQPNIQSLTDAYVHKKYLEKNPEYRDSIIDTPAGLISHNSKLPLRYYRLEDQGPGYKTPPRSSSPDIVPPLPEIPPERPPRPIPKLGDNYSADLF